MRKASKTSSPFNSLDRKIDHSAAGVDRLFLSIAETAAIFGLDHRTIRKQVRLGQIRSVRVGKTLLVPRAQFEALLTGGKEIA